MGDNISDANLRDEQSRRQWRRIAKEGRDFLSFRLAESGDPEKAHALRNAVNTIKADRAIDYDWETPVREALPQLVLLDRIYEDKGWVWEEAYTHPQRLTVVKLLLEEYSASGIDQLSLFCHLPPKTIDTHAGAIIFATLSTRFAEENFRNFTLLNPATPKKNAPKISVALWHKANLIPTEL